MVPELEVSDFARSLDFYVDALGFRARFTRTDPDFAYLERGEVQLMIQQTGSGWVTGVLEPPFGRGINFQMDAEDADVIHARLVAMDYPLFRPLRETWYATDETNESGQLEFLVQDPDGYLLRFAKFLGTRSKN